MQFLKFFFNIQIDCSHRELRQCHITYEFNINLHNDLSINFNKLLYNTEYSKICCNFFEIYFS